MNIKMIAEMAGVSVSTVSKIMNNYSDVSEKTKKRVLEIIEQTGYSPSNSAKTLATKKSNLIGVIFAGELNVEFTHPFFVEVLNSFKKQMGVLGYDLIFFSNEKFISSGDYFARAVHFNVDGCVIISGQKMEPTIHDLDMSSIPCIGVDLELKGKKSGFVMSDNFQISSKVVEHFYLLGYRELGFIGSAADSEISNLREAGYTKAIESFGLPLNRRWFVHGDDFFESSGYTAMQQLIQSGSLPKAIFAASDLLALGAIRALKEHDLRIPEDIAIIGCDDIEACKYTTPRLSTIRQNKQRLGILAAHMLYDLINNQSGGGSFVVEPVLVVRESCGSQLKF
ncbi:LacI family DNA-binding transcriptional regulator [Paenibacillus sp. FSL H7-0737]|uniref:LacI family DNA-binding transcriptional regulator n=1 Tax=Paenibacillus sp. FSL H7-0737 TaxID=1536775 RepID=UPI0004F794E6|nr:LacI family DNA-binding transcriptional regulator [Paenibacillus sp. FSL H7-0737]AIQ25961.1 transcriptional regulator [Paenibacillus sp. FSL H7-0737]